MSFRLFIILMLCSVQAFAQCLPAEELASKITDIEGSAVANNKKIAVLRSLADAHLKCISVKDSLYARALHRIGDLYWREGDIDNALNLTKEAIAINSSARSHAQPAYLANSYYNLGVYNNVLGRQSEAMGFFDSAIHFGSYYPNKHIIALMAYEQKSFLYFQRGDYQESIIMADEGIKFSTENNEPFYEAVMVIQKAQSQFALGDLAGAEKNITDGIKKLSNDPGLYLATAYSVYASVLEGKKEYAAAKQHFIKAFELNRQFNNWAQCARDLMDLGYLYDHYLSDARKAINEYNKAMKFAIQVDDKYLQASLLNNIGFVYWREKSHRQALSHYQHALNILPMGFDNPDWQINPSSDKLQSIANDYYLATLLFNKAQAMLDLSQREKNNKLIDGSLNTFLLADKVMTKMRWKQLFDESKLFWRQETKDMYERAIEACYLSNNKEKAFYFFEKSRAVLLKDKLLKLNYDSVISLKDAAERLKGQKQTLIEYFTGDSVLYILALGASDKFIKIPLQDFKNEAARMLDICSNAAQNNQRFGEYQKIALSLYRKLLEPLQVSSESIIISPDEEFIPFEALLTEDGYLLKKHAVSYTYSAELLFRNMANANNAKSFLGVAPVSYKKYLGQQPLNGSDRSLQTISNYFSAPELLVKEKATRSAFFSNLPVHRIVQLYSHGYAEGTDPVLYFNDSAVQLSEIQQIDNIQTELIALSACQTGTGKMAKGEGIFSFARGFYAAGIPSLLTTLWQVDDRSTYGITELFYKHLQEGLNKDAALRQAKLDFIAGNDKLYQLPYYWSSYILIGNADKIGVDNKRSMPVSYLIAGAAIIILILYFVIRKLRS